MLERKYLPTASFSGSSIDICEQTNVHLLFTPPCNCQGAEYCDERVCLSVCLSASTDFWNHPLKLRQIITECYQRPELGPSLGACDTLCTFGFVDGVMFAHNGRKRRLTKWQHRTAETEYDVYDCIVIIITLWKQQLHPPRHTSAEFCRSEQLRYHATCSRGKYHYLLSGWISL